MRPSRSRPSFRTAAVRAALLAGTLAACGDSTGTSPLATRSEAVARPTVTPTTAPAPSTSAAPTTTASPTLPPTTSAAPATTAAPTTAPTTTPTPAPPAAAPATTGPPAASGRPIAAIGANGDAVLVTVDGSTTLLLDGADPDDVVDEGPVVLIDTVAVASDGSFAFVSDCCEPSPGATYRIDPAVGPGSASTPSFGHGPALSPDGTRVASVAVDAVLVNHLVDGGSTHLSFPTPVTYPDQVAWADDGRIVMLDWSATATVLRAIDISSVGTLTEGPTTPVASDVPADRAATTMLAGRGEGVVFVADTTSAVVRAFDSTTLAPVPAADVTLDGAPLSVWIEDGEVRWVDTTRTLHVGGAVVPGSFLWVR